MKIGTYFAYWASEWQVNYLDYIPKAKAAGFDVLEISAGIAELSDEELYQLRDTAKAAGITLTLCLGIPKEYDVSSKDEKVRRQGVEYMKKLFVAMDKADIRKIGGIIYAYWPCDWREPVEKELIRQISIESVREMADFAAPLGITLNMETVNRFEHFLINDAFEAVEYVKDVNRPNVKVMLDCFHMNIEEDDFSAAIRHAGKYLGHFHIGECNRKVPGKGRIPWDELAEALRSVDYDGYVVMEPFVRTGGGVGSDIKVWRDMSDGTDNAGLDRDIRESAAFVRNIFCK